MKVCMVLFLFVIAAVSISAHTKGDFGVCGPAADPAVYRPGDTNLYYLSTCSGGYDQLTAIGMNSTSERWMPFNDGGTSDVFADFVGVNNRWNVFDRFGGLIETSYGYYPAGGTGFAGDVNGDGHDDFITYYQGEWTVYISRNHFGVSATYYLGDPFQFDKPAVGDFNGDGKADIAVFRPGSGKLFIYYINNEQTETKTMDGATNSAKVYAADMDGDGTDEVVVLFEPTNGSADSWKWRSSSNGLQNGVTFGFSTDIPAPGDYLGQGKEQPAFFRPSTGQWFAGDLDTLTSYVVGTFGTTGDVPVQNGRVH